VPPEPCQDRTACCLGDQQSRVWCESGAGVRDPIRGVCARGRRLLSRYGIAGAPAAGWAVDAAAA